MANFGMSPQVLDKGKSKLRTGSHCVEAGWLDLLVVLVAAQIVGKLC